MLIARKSVLLHVEDQELFHRAVEEGLEDAGVDVELRWAKDGQAAFDLLSDPVNSLPDLILLDIYMYPKDGFWFLEQISKWSPPIRDRLKIVILTTSKDEMDMIRAQSYGIDPEAFIQKPVRYEDLVRILEKLGHMFIPGKA